MPLNQLGTGPLGMNVCCCAIELYRKGLPFDDLGPNDAWANTIDLDLIGG